MKVFAFWLLVCSSWGNAFVQRSTSRKPSTLQVLPVDFENLSQHSMWLATIDSDIADMQLEDFRRVFAGGIAVMVGGLLSTTLLGTIIDKKDLYADLAVESYIDMADDPDFWRQMTEGMSPEEQEKAKELMAKIKAQRSGEDVPEMPTVVPTTTEEASKENTQAKASDDMFSDY